MVMSVFRSYAQGAEFSDAETEPDSAAIATAASGIASAARAVASAAAA